MNPFEKAARFVVFWTLDIADDKTGHRFFGCFNGNGVLARAFRWGFDYDRDDEHVPTCDLCGEPEDQDVMSFTENDWNGETGNHLSCEAKR